MFSDPDITLNVIYVNYKQEFEDASGMELECKQARFEECNALARFAVKYGYTYSK
jgi:hypothetical protein